LVSDVPLGAFLSGGVDSSLVVAAMGEASTFSIGFEEPGYNELAWSRKVAEHLGVRHTTEVIQPDIVDLFHHLMHFMEDPIGDFSIFPTYLVSRLARNEVTVALSGDGGDELFGGYDSYRAEGMSDRYGKLLSLLRSSVLESFIGRFAPQPAKKGFVNKARRFVEGFRNDPNLGHARWRLFLNDALSRSIFTPEARAEMGLQAELGSPAGGHIHELFSRSGPRDRVDQLLYVDLKSYLPENCLAKVDRMAMACSLEARVPFLDHELVELAFRVPSRLKLHRGEGKVLLKSLAAREVPRSCVYRQKEGFSIPIKTWLTTTLKPLMQESLDPERISKDGIFQPRVVGTLMKEHLEGVENHSHILWSLMVFQDWQDRWGP
jgi:asparagine synthase (glutamine-hydrolysing)